jgi:hypothetical protein
MDLWKGPMPPDTHSLFERDINTDNTMIVPLPAPMCAIGHAAGRLAVNTTGGPGRLPDRLEPPQQPGRFAR